MDIEGNRLRSNEADVARKGEEEEIRRGLDGDDSSKILPEKGEVEDEAEDKSSEGSEDVNQRRSRRERKARMDLTKLLRNEVEEESSSNEEIAQGASRGEAGDEEEGEDDDEVVKSMEKAGKGHELRTKSKEDKERRWKNREEKKPSKKLKDHDAAFIQGSGSSSDGDADSNSDDDKETAEALQMKKKNTNKNKPSLFRKRPHAASETSASPEPKKKPRASPTDVKAFVQQTLTDQKSLNGVHRPVAQPKETLAIREPEASSILPKLNKGELKTKLFTRPTLFNTVQRSVSTPSPILAQNDDMERRKKSKEEVLRTLQQQKKAGLSDAASRSRSQSVDSMSQFRQKSGDGTVVSENAAPAKKQKRPKLRKVAPIFASSPDLSLPESTITSWNASEVIKGFLFVGAGFDFNDRCLVNRSKDDVKLKASRLSFCRAHNMCYALNMAGSKWQKELEGIHYPIPETKVLKIDMNDLDTWDDEEMVKGFEEGADFIEEAWKAHLKTRRQCSATSTSSIPIVPPTIFVHCVAGVNRSPMVVVWWLCKYHGLKLRDAWELVRKRRDSGAHWDGVTLGGEAPPEGYVPSAEELERAATRKYQHPVGSDSEKQAESKEDGQEPQEMVKFPKALWFLNAEKHLSKYSKRE